MEVWSNAKLILKTTGKYTLALDLVVSEDNTINRVSDSKIDWAKIDVKRAKTKIHDKNKDDKVFIS